MSTESLSVARIDSLCLELSRRLWGLETSGPPHLVWPTKRDGTRRVSEQESKILLTQILEQSGVPYSIETPTVETYVQKGKTPLSARLDVTLYAPAAEGRLLNVELKAHNPDSESFRKDFEKLLREGPHGLWFHTLERAAPATWKSLFKKVQRAFRQVAEHIRPSQIVDFAFCDLAIHRIYRARLETDRGSDHVEHTFGPDPHDWRWSDGSGAWRGGSPIDMHAPAPKQAPGDRTRVRARTSTREKLLIYCPEIAPQTFLHLSIKGESYYLRNFRGVRKGNKWRQPDAETTSELKSSYRFRHSIDVTSEHYNLETHKDYWAERIRQENARHNLSN